MQINNIVKKNFAKIYKMSKKMKALLLKGKRDRMKKKSNFLIVISSILLVFIGKVNPVKFWKKAFEPWMIAFSTCTSSAAL